MRLNENFWFEVNIPPAVSFGDTIRYYFSAVDLATPPNRSVSEHYCYRTGKEDFEHGVDSWVTDSTCWALDVTDFFPACTQSPLSRGRLTKTTWISI